MYCNTSCDGTKRKLTNQQSENYNVSQRFNHTNQVFTPRIRSPPLVCRHSTPSNSVYYQTVSMHFVILVAITTTISVGIASAEPITCSYTKSTIRISPELGIYNADDELLVDNSAVTDVESDREVCPEGRNSCFTLWKESPVALTSENSTINETASSVRPVVMSILAQGCWESSSENDCLSTCVSRKRPSKSGTKFCCCQGLLCNQNVTDGYDPSKDSDDQLTLRHPYEPTTQQYGLAVVICISLAAMVLLIALIMFACRIKQPIEIQKSKDFDALHLTESQSSKISPTMPSYDLDTLKLEEIIGHGRYGSVYSGALQGEPVAIKVFNAQHKQYFINERDIYKLPFMDCHPGLLKFFGADEQQTGDQVVNRIECRLVISYMSKGCLQIYLREHTIDWYTMCKMLQSLASTLAYMHCDIRKV